MLSKYFKVFWVLLMFFSDYGIQIRLDAILMIQTEHSIHHSPCTCSFLASE